MLEISLLQILVKLLIGSGINKSGQLPIGRCYLTNILDDENLQKIIDEKLNQKWLV